MCGCGQLCIRRSPSKKRNLVCEIAKAIHQGIHASPVFQVLRVDVGHNGYSGVQKHKASIRLVGFGHPVGATGVKQPLELFRQMKGLCGDYQVDRPLTWGITSNMGGDDKTVVSFAVRNHQ